MFSRVFSGAIRGINPHLICVEADVSGGLPQFNMVGLLSNEVREARERVIRAFSNSEIEIPARKITINLSPAGLHKQGSGFDMPISVALLAALGQIPEKSTKDSMFFGELSLDGHFNCVNGVLILAMLAKNEGCNRIFVPKNNAFEATAVHGLEVVGVDTLTELISILRQGSYTAEEPFLLEAAIQSAYEQEALDYADVKGQQKAKRATEVAVAGFHHLMYIGPPGSGKSMMARRIPTILGRISQEECLEISKIYSVMGMLPEKSLMLKRPFRSPHQTITAAALIGGMSNPRPGEITLAHKGVLFLDEATEFKKEVIELLRQPLEEKQIVITRMAGNVTFPADFMLVMAMNPCRCGYYPDRQRCRCTLTEVHNYFGKVKGPLLDRIDICVGTSKLKIEEFEGRDEMTSALMSERIKKAQLIQERRFEGSPIRFNAQMTRKEIDLYCKVSENDKPMLEKAYEKYNLSARGYYKLLRVARTIADLEGRQQINRQDLLEAISYRNTYDV